MAVAAISVTLSESLRADEPLRPTTIVVIGAAGSPQFDSMFHEWSGRWIATADKAKHQIVVIGRDPEDNEQTDRKKLQSAIEAASKIPAVDLWIVFFGHGTYDMRSAKFNLRGPDVSAEDLANWLKPVNRPTAIINTASASAPFLDALSAQNRVVVVATKNGGEQNFSRFGDYLSQSIYDPEADLDKDGQTSLWEAFLSASRRTAEFYSTDGRLQTEHALLDDNGDLQGVRADDFRGLTPIASAEDNRQLDGSRAHQWHLLPNEIDSNLSPESRKKRNDLELTITELRDRKSEQPREDYLKKLEQLLIELAELNESIEAKP